MILAAIFNNTFYSYIQIFIGRGFDLITQPGWMGGNLPTAALLGLALGVMGTAVGQGLTGLGRN